MIALHAKDDVFSPRHIPSWLMLTLAAGWVNATAAVACDRYVTHVTGTVTRIGMEVARFELLADFTLVLLAFLAGAVMSALLINARAHRGKRPLYALPLVLVAMITAGVAISGHFGVLGAFHGTPDETGDFVMLTALSFASGLQNAAVATSTGLLVRTTHLTGPATDFAIHLVEMGFAQGDHRKSAVQHALLRGGKIVAFAVGAAGGVTLAVRVQYLAFIVPAAITLTATAVSYLPYRHRATAPATS